MNHARVLVIEDDASIAAGLRMNLRHEGFEVAVAKDGTAGLEMALETHPDLIILDVMLPEMNGFEVLKALRKRHVRAGVVMLTAKGLEEDKVLGLELGADDYVQKPFGLQELIARLHAVLRRKREAMPETVRFSDVVVDKRAQAVTRGGAEVALAPKELSLLMCFLESPGRAMPRDLLLDRAWGLGYDGTERTVDNTVVALRKKLEAEPNTPRHFVTVRGVGYRFEP